MSNSYYSPTKSVTGGALFLNWDSKEGKIYFNFLKQIAFNSDMKGNFDGKNRIVVKISQDEAADIVRAVRTNSECSFYHSFKDNKTTVSFRYYETKPVGEGDKIRKGFSLVVKKTFSGTVHEVKIGFTLGSAERLSLFLINALNHIFDSEYSQDIKRSKEFKKIDDSHNGKTSEKQEQISIKDIDLPEDEIQSSNDEDFDF